MLHQIRCRDVQQFFDFHFTALSSGRHTCPYIYIPLFVCVSQGEVSEKAPSSRKRGSLYPVYQEGVAVVAVHCCFKGMNLSRKVLAAAVLCLKRSNLWHLSFIYVYEGGVALPQSCFKGMMLSMSRKVSATAAACVKRPNFWHMSSRCVAHTL